jgi:abortive infection bacteriophage resistance protein
MRYAKPPLTFEEQADLLLGRGLLGDRATMISRLQSVNYYRLSGYWHTMRDLASDPEGNPGHRFRAGSTFDDVWNRYVFDRQLRLLVMDAIERIEVGVRSQLAYHHAHRHGPFGYVMETGALEPGARTRFLKKLNKELERSHALFVRHFADKYGDSHSLPPLWMAVEIVPFGGVLSLYEGCSDDIRGEVARLFGVHHTVFDSWLVCLNTVRNICAHHERLWNRTLRNKPKIPAKAREWNEPSPIENNKVFSVLCICQWSLRRVAPQSRWHERLFRLLEAFPGISRSSMGFVDDWRTRAMWQ